MKKVLLAFDGTNFSKGAFEFARQLNENERILLTGVFLPQSDYAGLWVYTDGIGVPILTPLVNDDVNTEVIEKNIEKFKHQCISNDIDFRIHKDVFEFSVPQLVSETRFADLLILGSEVFYKSFSKEPNDNLKNVLRKTECPVIIVPEQFVFPENLVLTYDGSDSSVFAIKQFAYQFPTMCNKPAVLIHMSKQDKNEMPDHENIEELAARHYSNLEFSTIHADPKKFFNTWLIEKENSMIISGSYGRSGISDMFTKSFISDVITNRQFPIYIWHT